MALGAVTIYLSGLILGKWENIPDIAEDDIEVSVENKTSYVGKDKITRCSKIDYEKSFKTKS